jgi:YHS domain-containing protein
MTMHRVFGLMLLTAGAAALFIFAGCSNPKHPGKPDNAGLQTLSPGKTDGECSPCMDPICGDRIGISDASWRSSHRGVEYVFDCEECKTRFDADPELFTQR